tara:strand:- start:53 stop:1024 length:972 start_codon:yes stop_codon:yes gene_type:complete
MNIETTPSALLSPQQITKARSIFRQGFSLISKNKIFKEKQHLYSSPSGFTPWKELLGRLMYYDIALPQAMRVGQKCDMEACVASSFALHYDSPVRYISKNLGEAFLRTSTKGIIKPPIALEHFIINLPKGLLVDDWDQSLDGLLVMTGMCFNQACARQGIKLVMDGFDGIYTFGFNDYGSSIIDTSSWKDLHHAKPHLDPYCVPGYETKTQAACMKMQQIVVHSLLTMAYKPELLSESESLSISSGHSFRDLGKTKQARNNVWIGKEFKSKSRKRLKSDDTEGSPLASHWRRGHWHTYLVGSKREKKTLKWIEPIHVNSEIKL